MSVFGGGAFVGLAVLLLFLAPDAEFAAPVRLLFAGKPIAVTGGHAAPRVDDFDGNRDLLVGGMHDHRTPKAQSNDLLTGFVWLYLRKK